MVFSGHRRPRGARSHHSQSGWEGHPDIEDIERDLARVGGGTYQGLLEPRRIQSTLARIKSPFQNLYARFGPSGRRLIAVMLSTGKIKNTTRKNSTRAIPPLAAEMPVKPKRPATIEITKKISAHLSICMRRFRPVSLNVRTCA
jgi:hypothetical protein